MTEYYLSIYFQGVRGFTPTKSGLLGLPMILGLSVASMAAAAGTTIIGYYFRESSAYCAAGSLLTNIVSFLVRNQYFGTNRIRFTHNPGSQWKQCKGCSSIRLPRSCHRLERPRAPDRRTDCLGTTRCVDRWCYHLLRRRHGLCALDLCICHTVSESPGQ